MLSLTYDPPTPTQPRLNDNQESNGIDQPIKNAKQLRF